MKLTVPLIALVSLFALASCGGDTSAGNASCRSTYQQYVDCGVFDGGFLGTCHSQVETRFAQCEAACINEASCGDIEDYICNDDPNACLDDCLDEDFQCDNGREIPSGRECDGRDDCFDFSDEEDCDVPIFRCQPFAAGGETIGGGEVCDFTCDCPNCSDEDECGEFTCVE